MFLNSLGYRKHFPGESTSQTALQRSGTSAADPDRSEGGLHARNGLCEFPARACGCVWLVGEAASLGVGTARGFVCFRFRFACPPPPPVFVCVLCTWPGGELGFPQGSTARACRSQGDLAPGVLETLRGARFSRGRGRASTHTPATLVLGYFVTGSSSPPLPPPHSYRQMPGVWYKGGTVVSDRNPNQIDFYLSC